jgi:hypothetical protein
MLGSIRTGVAAGIAVLFGIAGMFYALAASAAPPGGTTAAVEFTPDGKLKRPDGYRKWVYVGTPLTPNDLNDGEARFPEFHAVSMDPETPLYLCDGRLPILTPPFRIPPSPKHLSPRLLLES